MKDYVVRLSIKLVSFMYLALCIGLFVYLKEIELLLILVSISSLFVCTFYTLAKLIEKILKRQFNIIYFIVHCLSVLLLIFLLVFIYTYNVTKITFVIALLISYPIILLISFVIAFYVYTKKLSRK